MNDDERRGALGELMKLSMLFYTERGAHAAFGLLCAERAVGILEGKVAPHIASDELIAEFRRWWAGRKRRRPGTFTWDGASER